MTKKGILRVQHNSGNRSGSHQDRSGATKRAEPMQQSRNHKSRLKGRKTAKTAALGCTRSNRERAIAYNPRAEPPHTHASHVRESLQERLLQEQDCRTTSRAASGGAVSGTIRSNQAAVIV